MDDEGGYDAFRLGEKKSPLNSKWWEGKNQFSPETIEQYEKFGFAYCHDHLQFNCKQCPSKEGEKKNENH